ncbi:MAG: glycosyltransferase family 39 protein [Promethearchaeota archaeon]
MLVLISFLLSLIRPLIETLIPSIDFASMPDSEQYAKLVDFFRGTGDLDDVSNAWKIRLLVPLLASIIPLDPITSLNLISLVFNLLSVIIFYKLLERFQFNLKKRVLGTLMFVFAAPTIVLGFTPLTDTSGIFFILISLYIYQTFNRNIRNDLILGIVIGIGVLARETVVFIVPVLVLWEVIDKGLKWKEVTLFTACIGALAIAIYAYLKLIFAPRPVIGPIIEAEVINNIKDLFDERTLATIAQLVFILLVGIYGVYMDIFNKSKMEWKLLLGCACFIIPLGIVFLYENMSFRFLWVFFIFSIPIFLRGIDKINENGDTSGLKISS